VKHPGATGDSSTISGELTAVSRQTRSIRPGTCPAHPHPRRALPPCDSWLRKSQGTSRSVRVSRPPFRMDSGWPAHPVRAVREQPETAQSPLPSRPPLLREIARDSIALSGCWQNAVDAASAVVLTLVSARERRTAVRSGNRRDGSPRWASTSPSGHPGRAMEQPTQAR